MSACPGFRTKRHARSVPSEAYRARTIINTTRWRTSRSRRRIGAGFMYVSPPLTEGLEHTGRP